MKVIFNGTEDHTTKSTLKEYLLDKGYAFPCNGRGICGKCIVSCPSLQETARDVRFLSEADRAAGLRLACDKSVVDGMVVDVEIVSVPRFCEADACVVVQEDSVEVCLVAGTYQEVRVEQLEELSSTAVKSAIAHALLELLEKHSVAKATTIYLLGSRACIESVTHTADLDQANVYDGVEMMLPSDEVYVVPFGGGSDSVAYLCDRADAQKSTAFAMLVSNIRFRSRL